MASLNEVVFGKRGLSISSDSIEWVWKRGRRRSRLKSNEKRYFHRAAQEDREPMEATNAPRRGANEATSRGQGEQWGQAASHSSPHDPGLSWIGQAWRGLE